MRGNFAENLIGARFGRLLVIGRSENTKQNKSAWLCKCDCGNEKIVSRRNLKGATNSCGCLARELSSKRLKNRVIPIDERIKERIKKQSTGCWIYTGLLDRNGYGLISVNGKTNYTHRYMYAKHKGGIGNKCVLHKCDTPACCNPEHLFVGTRRDNMDDKVKKSRQLRGVEIKGSKLTDKKVKEIRNKYDSGMRQPKLSQIYGISQSVLSGIVNRKRWKHVD